MRCKNRPEKETPIRVLKPWCPKRFTAAACTYCDILCVNWSLETIVVIVWQDLNSVASRFLLIFPWPQPLGHSTLDFQVCRAASCRKMAVRCVQNYFFVFKHDLVFDGSPVVVQRLTDSVPLYSFYYYSKCSCFAFLALVRRKYLKSHSPLFVRDHVLALWWFLACKSSGCCSVIALYFI